MFWCGFDIVLGLFLNTFFWIMLGWIGAYIGWSWVGFRLVEGKFRSVSIWFEGNLSKVLE